MLKIDRITIRTVEEKDLDSIHRWNTSEFRGEYQECTFESKQSLIKHYHEDGFCTEQFQMLMIDFEEVPIGLVYISFVRQGLANIGIVICEQGRGKGIGVTCTLKIVEYIFSNYDVCRIQADTDCNNVAAQKVLEKAGFIKEGILRKYRYHHGKYNDSILYSMIR